MPSPESRNIPTIGSLITKSLRFFVPVIIKKLVGGVENIHLPPGASKTREFYEISSKFRTAPCLGQFHAAIGYSQLWKRHTLPKLSIFNAS